MHGCLGFMVSCDAANGDSNARHTGTGPRVGRTGLGMMRDEHCAEAARVRSRLAPAAGAIQSQADAEWRQWALSGPCRVQQCSLRRLPVHTAAAQAASVLPPTPTTDQLTALHPLHPLSPFPLLQTLALWQASMTAFEANNLAEAMGRLEEISEIPARLIFNMAQIATRTGDLSRAHQLLTQTLVKDKHLAVAFFARGVISYKLSRWVLGLSSAVAAKPRTSPTKPPAIQPALRMRWRTLPAPTT